MEALDAYSSFLWSQLQYDWSVLTNPWILYPVIPALLYIIFFAVKWWVLLVPITLPCSILSGKLKPREEAATQHKSSESSDVFEKELDKLLKG